LPRTRKNTPAAAEGASGDAPARTLVILPTFNERLNLEAIAGGVRGQGCDVLVVDDNSPDGTGEVADSLARADPGVHVLHRSGKLGLGTAYIAGLQHGVRNGYDLLVTMDADGSHNPAHLPALIAAARRTRGVAIGSRYIPGGAIVGWKRHRLALSWTANTYARTILGIRVHDCTSGYRCYPRTVIERVDLDRIVADGYAFLIEMLYICLNLPSPVTEVPIRFEDRLAGRSKVSSSEIVKSVALVPRLRLRGRRAMPRAR
jgi:glycosyltransferase involved in cell wall biosynthesis